MKQIAGNVTSLAAVSEEISSAMQELENQTTEVTGQCENLTVTTVKMNEVAGEVNKTVNQLYMLQDELGKSVNAIYELGSDPLFQRDERTYYVYTGWLRMSVEGWMKTLRVIVDNKEVVPIDLAMKESTFGKCYAVLTPNKEEAMPHWKKIYDAQEKMFKLAQQICGNVEKNSYGENEALYRETENLSKTLFEELKTVVGILVKTDFSAIFKAKGLN